MKRSIFFTSALIILLSFGVGGEAAAQRWGHHPRGRAYGYWRHHPRVWVAPPPPRPVVVVPPRPYYRYYGRPRYYAPPRYYAQPRYYSYGRPHRRW